MSHQGQFQVTIDILDREKNYLPLNEVIAGFNNNQMLKILFNAGSIEKNEYGKFLKAAVAFSKKV